MQQKYALFFDIDGTLVSFDTHQIPPSTILALTQAKANGHKVLAMLYITDEAFSINNNLLYDNNYKLFLYNKRRGKYHERKRICNCLHLERSKKVRTYLR